MKCEGVIHSDPEILGGTVVFVGTRVPVQSLFDHLESGDSIDDFLEGFPSVRRDQVLAVLQEFRRVADDGQQHGASIGPFAIPHRSHRVERTQLSSG